MTVNFLYEAKELDSDHFRRARQKALTLKYPKTRAIAAAIRNR